MNKILKYLCLIVIFSYTAKISAQKKIKILTVSGRGNMLKSTKTVKQFCQAGVT